MDSPAQSPDDAADAPAAIPRGPRRGEPNPGRRHPMGVGFLLAQVGALGSRLFAERVAPLGLTPTQSGLIRLIARNAGRNQQELAGQLGVRPSRLVVVLDGLQDAGLVQRITDPDDHRRKTVAVTDAGKEKLAQLVGLAAIHEDYLCRALSAEQRNQLAELLATIAADHGLAPGVHPGHGDG